jgi:hypothetical protein
MQTREEGLHQPRQQSEGEDLTAMGVPRDLKVDPMLAGFLEVHRLMREKHDRLARVSAVHGTSHVRTVAVTELVCRPIVDPGDVDGVAILGELDVLVTQDSDTDAAEKAEP